MEARAAKPGVEVSDSFTITARLARTQLRYYLGTGSAGLHHCGHSEGKHSSHCSSMNSSHSRTSASTGES